jgi:tetratricopeptide (TPR) repeat protein
MTYFQYPPVLMRRARALLVLATVAFALPAHAQHDDHGAALPGAADQPIAYMPKALGPFSHEILTSYREAQQFFDQGMQLEFAYGKYEAIRSFREAVRVDPDCAMCYWGEAWAWGSYLNAKMTPEEAPHAYAAIQKAIALKPRATPQERDYIDALAVRYVADFDPETQRVQDEAYAAAMAALAEKYPDDLDAQTLYADALFLLLPRRGYRDENDPAVRQLHAVLESVLVRDIRHPGACHLYVHATESTAHPEKADACAAFLGDAIPGASHINHMPSHTWNEIGRWGDSVRANLKAWHSDQKAAAGTGEGVPIYPPHNLHMLLFAASYDGQGAIATQAGREHTKLTGDNGLELLTLVRFGRFDDILAMASPPGETDYAQGVWDFAQGYTHLKQGEPDFARVYLERLTQRAAATEELARFHPVERLLGVFAGILQGEVELHEGDTRRAIAAFERAVEHEDALDYDEPEPLPFAARHWLGAALLDAKRFRDAEHVYREELLDHPHNGWSLFGLSAALAGQGKADAAVDADLAQSWARSDVWLRRSAY